MQYLSRSLIEGGLRTETQNMEFFPTNSVYGNVQQPQHDTCAHGMFFR